MIKYAIRLYNNEKDAHLIFHSTPDQTHYIWQWYITDDKDSIGKVIEGEDMQSFITTTDLIKENNYDGLFLYCSYRNRNTQEQFKTELIPLYADVNKIIESGTVFDDISTYDKTGEII